MKFVLENTLIAALILVIGFLGFNIVTGCSTAGKVQAVTKSGIDLMTNPGNVPGLVKLTTPEGRPFCSGFVVSNTQVVTAAHCVAQGTIFGVQVQQEVTIESIAKNFEKTIITAESKSVNLRQDSAIIIGDFSKFSKVKISTDPNADILANNYRLASCGFPYGGRPVCYTLEQPVKMVDMIGFRVGQMYAGMSGGPVIDLNTGTVYALNHAVAEGIVIVAPIVNLFSSQSVVGE